MTEVNSHRRLTRFPGRHEKHRLIGPVESRAYVYNVHPMCIRTVGMAIQFRCESLVSRFQNPGDEAYSERKLQVRFDPLAR